MTKCIIGSGMTGIIVNASPNAWVKCRLGIDDLPDGSIWFWNDGEVTAPLYAAIEGIIRTLSCITLWSYKEFECRIVADSQNYSESGINKSASLKPLAYTLRPDFNLKQLYYK